MNDITSTTPLRLEDLPDEILLEIFQYIEPIDFINLKGHNQRLNNVVQDVKLGFVTNCPHDDIDTIALNSCLKTNSFSLSLPYCWHNFYWRWIQFDSNMFENLRSLQLHCGYALNNHLEHVFSVNLPRLERISIDFVPNYLARKLLQISFDNKRLPSLRTCQFKGDFYFSYTNRHHTPLPNSTIRALAINEWHGSQLNFLLDLLPNLRWFETNLIEPVRWPSGFNKPYTSLVNVRVTFHDLSNDLDTMLQFMPNLKKLRIRGMINEYFLLQYFEKLKEMIHFRTPVLQRFDCELYIRTLYERVSITAIQQLTPFFKNMQCFFDKFYNECYTTDLTKYPKFRAYELIRKLIEDNPGYLQSETERLDNVELLSDFENERHHSYIRRKTYDRLQFYAPWD